MNRAAITSVQMENAWLTGKPWKIFLFCIIIKMPLAFFLVLGTLKPIQPGFASEDLNRRFKHHANTNKHLKKIKLENLVRNAKHQQH